jgi:nucleoside-diphosphate-sugar epimerase
LESPENDSFRDASLEFVRRLWELGTQHVVALGTCVEYQLSNRPLSEDDTPAAPTTRYARCKNQLRLALETEAKSRSLPFCWSRLFYPYGPREHPSRLASSIITKLRHGENLTLKTPASTKDYIYIEDVAGALLTVIESRYSGIINLGTGAGITVREIALRLSRLLGKTELIAEATVPDPDPFPFVVADASKLRGLGWRPAWSLEQGLAKLVSALNS